MLRLLRSLKTPASLLPVLVLLTLARPAAADVLTLRNGETVECEVLDVTRTKVTVKAKVFNIATTKEYRRSEIKDIEYKPLPEGFWDSVRVTDDDNTGEDESEEDAGEEDAEDARRGPGSKEPQDQYVVVPIHGDIGTEVTSEGLRKALAQSKGRGVGHIVFVVDSPGGYVYEAVSILELLKEFDDDFEYHCVIEAGAISAASVFAAGSDRIYVRADARLGGAVAYTTENSTGAAEVDAKYNSIWSANIASRADAKGHQGDVFRAMVVLEAELWQAEDGTLHADGRSGGTQIGSPTTILTIRASQMVRAGMATAFEGEPAQLGEVLGRPDWTEVRGIGVRAMTFAARDRIDMERRYNLAIAELTKATDAFAEADPRKHTYGVLRSTNGVYRLDPASMNEWTSRSDRAISAAKTMLQCLRELAAITTRAERTKALHLLTPEGVGRDAYNTVNSALSWLKEHRNNPPARDMVNRSFGP